MALRTTCQKTLCRPLINRITIFAFIPEILLPYPEGLPHPTSHRPTPTHTLTYCSLILMVCPTLHPTDPPLHTLSHTPPLSWWPAPPYIPPTHPYTHSHILLPYPDGLPHPTSHRPTPTHTHILLPYPDGLPHPTSHRPTPTHTLTYCSLILMACTTLHPTDPPLHTQSHTAPLSWWSAPPYIPPTHPYTHTHILLPYPEGLPHPTSHPYTHTHILLPYPDGLHHPTCHWATPTHTLSHTAPLSWWPAPPYIPPTHPYTHTHILLPYPDGLPHPTSHRPTPTHTLTYCSLILMVCPTLHPTDPPLHTHSHTAPLSWWSAPPYIPPTHPYTHTHSPFPLTLNSPSRPASTSVAIFSTFLRSAREQCGGRHKPRMLRPVRTRLDSTYFSSKTASPRASQFKSVLCLASGA